MKHISSVTLIISLTFSQLLSQAKPIDYFGQASPGMKPEIFAPDFISTSAFEFCGTFSPDGQAYFFTRRASYDGWANRIYYTHLTENGWSNPTLAPIAEDLFEFEPAITPDGSTLYFYSERQANRDASFDGDLWFSKATNTGWSTPRHLASPINKKYCMNLSSTENGVLYFSSAFEGQRGIFRSKDGMQLEYLPQEINKIYGAHPYISPDESWLIMDSQVSGRGQPELFISFRNTDDTWTQAVNMGPEINATKTEFGASLSPDAKYLFFHRRVHGNGDIYWVDAKIIEDLKEKVLKKLP